MALNIKPMHALAAAQSGRHRGAVCPEAAEYSR
jgi:hypothetical protein